MIIRVSAYILIGLGIVVFLFFRYYSGTLIPYPFLMWLLGIGMIVGGLIIITKIASKEDASDMENMNSLIKELKETGEMINVEFADCEIKSNNYTEERERYRNSKIQAWNAIGGDADKNVKQVDIHQSVIVYNHKQNGEVETFYSRVIPKEKITLMFLLSSKKNITLYVDRDDRTRYYFDLDFLNY
jgi:hypothetical protein